ncbi:hypothetical protein MRX96_023118 [Rhipicephalus microplus]
MRVPGHHCRARHGGWVHHRQTLPRFLRTWGRKKRAPLLTLRKRLARRRWRASKGFDHAQVFNDFLNSAGWTVREVAALVHDYEATGALRELTAHADAARPPARSCRADLGRLLESRLCTDVTLAYRGTAFPAHRALLSARCPFFRDLLSEGARQQMMVLEMDIPGVGVELFGDLLRYLYTGELSVAGEAGSSAALSTLLRLSEQFGVPNPLAHDLRRMLEGGHLADASLVWEVPGSVEQDDGPLLVVKGGRMRIVLDGTVVPLRYARILLWALYQDTVDLSVLSGSLAEELMELYQVARLIEVDSLAQDTLCGVLQWSEQPHGSPWVHRQAMAFLAEEFSALAATPLLFQLTKGQLLALLQSNFLQASELEVLVAVLKWGGAAVAQEDGRKRAEHCEPDDTQCCQAWCPQSAGPPERQRTAGPALRAVVPCADCTRASPRCGSLAVSAAAGPFSSPTAVHAGRGGGTAFQRSCGLLVDWPSASPLHPLRGRSQGLAGGAALPGASIGTCVTKPPPHLSHIPDTLYMVDKGATFREACVPHGPAPAVRLPDPSLPVLSEELLRQMRQRMQELRHGAARAYSLGGQSVRHQPPAAAACDLRLHRQPHLGRRALRLAELQSENLSKMIPDIAMATATLEHLDLAESDKDEYGCEVGDLSPVHMLV